MQNFIFVLKVFIQNETCCLFKKANAFIWNNKPKKKNENLLTKCFYVTAKLSRNGMRLVEK